MTFHSSLDPFLGFSSDSSCAYYTVDSFNTHYGPVRDKFLIFMQNIRSFNCNMDEFLLYVGNLRVKINVIVLTETWFGDDIIQDIPNYVGFHTYRSNRGGGGVSVYVRDECRSKNLPNCSLINEFCEICTVNVSIENFSINIIGVYRPPGGDDGKVFCDTLKTNIFPRFLPSETVILCGDTNINTFENTCTVDYYNDLLYSKSFLPYITLPTRVTDSTFSNIDHIWCNLVSNVSSGVFENNITDHYTVFSCIYDVKSKDEMVTKQFRDHSEDCIDLFRFQLRNKLENFHVYDGLGVQMRSDIFDKILWDCYNKCCPVRSKTVSKSKLFKPWFDHDLKMLCNQKHDLFRKYRRGLILYDQYSKFNKDFSFIIKKCKINYFRNKFHSCANNIKKTWSTINSVIGGKRRRVLSEVIKEGVHYTSNTDMAECFDNYFGSIASNLRSNIPSTDLSPLSYMGDRMIVSMEYEPATVFEVENIFSKLKTNKSHINSIPVNVFKSVMSIISPAMCALYNSSINESIFPEIFKTARVTPIHKTGSFNDVKNYRPISILPTLSKVFERLTYNRLIIFLDNNDILSNHQFGFRKGFNTIGAVNDLLEIFYESLNCGKISISVFLDLSKAFDTLDHNILISKLEHIGVRGSILCWLSSYLSGRRQCVNINSTFSSSIEILSGVPQGSILGPLLFLIYINDMSRCVSSLNCVHFADDTTVSLSGHDFYDLFDIINDGLREIQMWLNVNKLSLNSSKTTYMIISNRCVPDDLNLSICGNILTRVVTQNFLGVLIDNKLTFKSHIHSTCRKISRSIGILYKLRPYVEIKTLCNLYFALVHSHFCYGMTAWGSVAASNLNRVICLQRRAVKLIPGNYDSNCREYGILKLNDLFKYFCSIRFFRYLTSNPDFNNLFPSHNYRTRNIVNNCLSVHLATRSRCQQSLRYKTAGIWNSIPLDIRESNSLVKFRRSYKAYLLNQ